jgi:hypothetical protein
MLEWIVAFSYYSCELTEGRLVWVGSTFNVGTQLGRVDVFL